MSRYDDHIGTPAEDLEHRTAAALMREVAQARRARDEDRNRLGIVQLDEDAIRTFFDLPEGYEIVSVHADWQRRTISVMVRSDDLEPTTPGSEAPMVPGSWDRETFLEPSSELEGPAGAVRPRRLFYRMRWSRDEGDQS